jgi:hypothetical protein
LIRSLAGCYGCRSAGCLSRERELLRRVGPGAAVRGGRGGRFAWKGVLLRCCREIWRRRLWRVAGILPGGYAGSGGERGRRRRICLATRRSGRVQCCSRQNTKPAGTPCPAGPTLVTQKDRVCYSRHSLFRCFRLPRWTVSKANCWEPAACLPVSL